MTEPHKPAATASPHARQRTATGRANAGVREARRILILKGIVIALGVLIVIALVALVAGIFIKGAGAGKPVATALPAEIAVPAGTTVEAMSSARGELAVALRHPDGRLEILVIDTRRGRLLQRLRLAPAPAR